MNSGIKLFIFWKQGEFDQGGPSDIIARSATGDPDDATTTRPSDCRDPNTFIVAWGTETNIYEHLGGADDLDVFITRSTDKGVSYEPYRPLAGAESPSFNELEEMESQLRATPDGKTVFSVWNEVSDETGANGRFAISVESDIPIEPPNQWWCGRRRWWRWRRRRNRWHGAPTEQLFLWM